MSHRHRPFSRAIIAVALISSGCVNDSTTLEDGVGASESTIATSPTAIDRGTSELEAWANRSVEQILDDGFDTGPCLSDTAEPSPSDESSRSAAELGWAFLPLPLDVTEIEQFGEDVPAVALSTPEVFPGPGFSYNPTHALIHPLDRPMLATLADSALTDEVEVVLGLAPTEQGSDGGDVRPATATFAWLLHNGEVIPFNPDCFWIATMHRHVGDLSDEIELLRNDPLRRAEVAGLTDDVFDPGSCRNPDLDLADLRVGFGGPNVGLAFGAQPSPADGMQEVAVSTWTVLSPVGTDEPAALEYPVGGPPHGFGLDPNGWLLAFTEIEGRAVVHSVFHVDPVVGLHIWSPQDPTSGNGSCFDARQVIAFGEFLDNTVPDRPRWDLTPVSEGSEVAIIDTITRLRNEPSVRAQFHAWTPCTHKLCERTGDA